MSNNIDGLISQFFKRLIQYIRGLFSSSKPEIQEQRKEPKPKPKPVLYFDRYIIFKNAPLIGKVFHKGKQMYRVVSKEIYYRRWKCQLELI